MVNLIKKSVDAHLELIQKIELHTTTLVREVMMRLCEKYQINFWSGMGGYGVLLPYSVKVVEGDDYIIYTTDNMLSKYEHYRKCYLPDDFGLINGYDPTGWYDEFKVIEAELSRLPGNCHILSYIGDIDVTPMTDSIVEACRTTY